MLKKRQRHDSSKDDLGPNFTENDKRSFLTKNNLIT